MRLFSFAGTISRGEYVAVAVVGAIVKHGVDIVAARALGRDWGPLNYLLPLGVPLKIGSASAADLRFIAIMTLVSVPFAWVGLAITARRFRTLGWPAWLIVLFFVPAANVVCFALAAAWPERTGGDDAGTLRLERFVPADPLGAAMVALVVTTVLGVVLVPLATIALQSYGWGLFCALPFVQGAVAAYINRLHGPRPVVTSMAVAVLSEALTVAALLAFALEGVLCIAMAIPIALVFCIAGAAFGHAIGSGASRPSAAALMLCVACAPAIMGAEAFAQRTAPVYAIATSIDVDAPPAAVWRHVVAFPPLAPPGEIAFRAGVAYPLGARIVGTGVGAVRFCTFSTGSFVEPITAWEPGRRLAFSVTRNAPPMREWSPYGPIDTPHLHGYMQSRRGEFDLEALPHGRTRLTGRTWYQHHLWPAAYWALWSDAIVHQIHGRVLRHIKKLSEAARRDA